MRIGRFSSAKAPLEANTTIDIVLNPIIINESVENLDIFIQVVCLFKMLKLRDEIWMKLIDLLNAINNIS